MEKEGTKNGFTVYLEGHEGHRGNVLLHSFLGKVHRLQIVLHKLERAYLDAGTRQTDFEIINADKRNPTTISLKPVPKVKAYDPTPAFEWGINQIDAVSKGHDVDPRIGSGIADDLVRLATRDSEYGYKAFWINGYAEAVRFDDDFLINALKLAKQRVKEEAPFGWHTGVAYGSVIGELKAVDDVDGNKEFVIIPPTGPDKILCVFSDELRDTMNQYLFKKVRVEGNLHYKDTSPFPDLVTADNISAYPARQKQKNFEQMRGMFSKYKKPNVDWDELLGV